jgi:hypothetical protein
MDEKIGTQYAEQRDRKQINSNELIKNTDWTWR